MLKKSKTTPSSYISHNWKENNSRHHLEIIWFWAVHLHCKSVHYKINIWPRSSLLKSILKRMPKFRPQNKRLIKKTPNLSQNHFYSPMISILKVLDPHPPSSDETSAARNEQHITSGYTDCTQCTWKLSGYPLQTQKAALHWGQTLRNFPIQLMDCKMVPCSVPGNAVL